MSDQKLQVIEGKAGAYPILQGSAALKTLAEVSFVDQFIMETKEGVQRPLHKPHAREFREYIQKSDATAPPLIFSMRVPVRLENGHLVLPKKGTSMARLDAQHRMAFTEDLDVELPFVIYHGVTKEQECNIFTTINDKHKGLSKSLVDAHEAGMKGHSKPHLAIAMKLNEDADSPWHDAVNTGGISKSTPGSKRKITLRTFSQAILVLISGSRARNAKFETKYEIVKNYWKAVVHVFPDEWINHRKNLITKGVGIAALADIGKDVIQECLSKEDHSVAEMTKYIGKLSGLDWGNKTSPFSTIGGRKGAAVVAKVMQAIVFGDSSVGDVDDLVKKFAIE